MSSQQDLIKPIDAEAFMSSIFAGHPADEHILIARQLTANSGGFTHSCWGGKGCSEVGCAQHPSGPYTSTSALSDSRKRRGRWRRRTRDCIAAYVLVLDDVGTKSKPVTVEPTYKLETSAGNFQWGYRINPCRDGDLYSAIVKAVANAGFGDPGAGGFNRLMRIPGSVNIKPGRNNFVSTITEWHPERCFELEDLAKHRVVPSACHVSRVTPSPIAGENEQDDTDDMDHVLGWLKQMAMSSMMTEQNGSTYVAHGMMSTPLEVKLRVTAPWQGEDGWRETRGFKCMHAHCAERTYQDFSSWIVGSGGPAARSFDPLPLLQRQWVIVNRGTQFADLFQRPHGGEWIYSEKEWSNMHFRRITVQHHDKPVLLKTAFMENRATRRATALKYCPGEGEIFDHRKQRYVNSWTEPLHSHTDLLPDVFLEHIQYILPIIPEQECFLDWLAYKIQHPASRSYAVVMVADNVFGTGRSWIARMLERVTQGQSGKVTLKQLIGKELSRAKLQ